MLCKSVVNMKVNANLSSYKLMHLPDITIVHDGIAWYTNYLMKLAEQNASYKPTTNASP